MLLFPNVPVKERYEHRDQIPVLVRIDIDNNDSTCINIDTVVIPGAAVRSSWCAAGDAVLEYPGTRPCKYSIIIDRPS